MLKPVGDADAKPAGMVLVDHWFEELTRHVSRPE